MRNTFAKIVWWLLPTTLLACAGDPSPAQADFFDNPLYG